MPAVLTSARFTLDLAKEDFKFSAAHFTLFPRAESERLHGHNYRVRVALTGSRLDELGLLADIAEVKAHIRGACDAWDERTLLPTASPRVQLVADDATVTVTHEGRHYQFPRADVVLLPLPNISIELLALTLWQLLAPVVAPGLVEELSVEVEETAGQSCRYVGRVS